MASLKFDKAQCKLFMVMEFFILNIIGYFEFNAKIPKKGSHFIRFSQCK